MHIFWLALALLAAFCLGWFIEYKLSEIAIDDEWAEIDAMHLYLRAREARINELERHETCACEQTKADG